MALALRFIFFQFMVLFQLFSCNGQSISQQLNYTAPFDSIHIEYFKDRINRGYSHLLLIKTPPDINEDFYLISTEWFTQNYPNKMSFDDVNNLLNGSISEHDQYGLFPVTLHQLDFYKEEKTCDLIREIFDKQGLYQPSADYYSSNVILLAVLVNRGIHVSLSDVDGEPIIDINSIGCN
jgi:hypothetical protein